MGTRNPTHPLGDMVSMLSLLFATIMTATTLAQPPEPSIGPVNSYYRYASEAATETWHDLKFGLRIHWGLYSIEGLGPESWPLYFPPRPADETSTRYWQNASCPDFVATGKGCQAFESWYYRQADNWNPAAFDASQWIDLMQRS